MNPEIDAEVVLATGAANSATPVSSFGFIVSFGSESYSAAVIPNGSASLKQSVPSKVRLRFLVPEAQRFLRPGARFSFFEQGRTGEGHVL